MKVKENVRCVEQGLTKLEYTFFYEKDFKFWKEVIAEADICIKSGSSYQVSLFSIQLIKLLKICFDNAITS